MIATGMLARACAHEWSQAYLHCRYRVVILAQEHVDAARIRVDNMQSVVDRTFPELVQPCIRHTCTHYRQVIHAYWRVIHEDGRNMFILRLCKS